MIVTIEVEDGGPAFPSADNPGMSLRDYFAAKAMQAIIQTSTMKSNIANTLHGEPDEEVVMDDASCVAEGAYQMADAMLNVRKIIKQRRRSNGN